MRPPISVVAVLIAGVVSARPVDAQSGNVATFIIAHGKDTVSVEQFARSGNTITGVWISNRGRSREAYGPRCGARGGMAVPSGRRAPRGDRFSRSRRWG